MRRIDQTLWNSLQPCYQASLVSLALGATGYFTQVNLGNCMLILSSNRSRPRISALMATMAFCLSLLHGSDHATGAVIEGTVPLPPSPAPAVMAKRYEIVSKGGILSTIPPVGVVWLEGDFPPAKDPPTLQIIQKDFVFNPALLPVRTGTVVEFPNEDDEYHNVFSYSPAKRFDLGRYLPEERPIPSQVFDQAGMVTLRCDIHEHMRAIILVIDSPYFVATDTKGNFRLEDLPEGDYVLKAWINSRTTLEMPVRLIPGKTLAVKFKQD